jgi:hypothetical protein
VEWSIGGVGSREWDDGEIFGGERRIRELMEKAISFEEGIIDASLLYVAKWNRYGRIFLDVEMCMSLVHAQVIVACDKKSKKIFQR